MALPYGEWSGSKLSLAEQSQSGWNWIVLKVPRNPTHSVIIQGDLWPCANGQPVPMGNISQLYGKETQPQPAPHAAHQIIKKKVWNELEIANCKETRASVKHSVPNPTPALFAQQISYCMHQQNQSYLLTPTACYQLSAVGKKQRCPWSGTG